MAITMNKQTLRREAIRQRDHQTESERTEKSNAICRRLFSIDLIAQADDLLLYADFGSEVKTGPIFNTAKRMRKRVYFPKVEGDDLVFYRVEDPSELQIGYKGIQEPFMLRRTAGDWIYAAAAVIPGVAFSRDGYRLGYGKGFYDRFLGRYPSIYSVGVGYQLQLHESLPHESHDQRLDALVTEEESLFWSKQEK